jgi:hypothetical protein
MCYAEVHSAMKEWQEKSFFIDNNVFLLIYPAFPHCTEVSPLVSSTDLVLILLLEIITSPSVSHNLYEQLAL